MEAANKTEGNNVRPIASMVLLWIVNAIFLIHNFFYLSIEGINSVYGVFGHYKQIVPATIYIGMLVFMIVKEIKIKRLWLKTLLNLSIGVFFMLTFAYIAPYFALNPN